MVTPSRACSSPPNQPQVIQLLIHLLPHSASGAQAHALTCPSPRVATAFTKIIRPLGPFIIQYHSTSISVSLSPYLSLSSLGLSISDSRAHSIGLSISVCLFACFFVAKFVASAVKTKPRQSKIQNATYPRREGAPVGVAAGGRTNERTGEEGGATATGRGGDGDGGRGTGLPYFR